MVAMDGSARSCRARGGRATIPPFSAVYLDADAPTHKRWREMIDGDFQHHAS